MIASQYTMILTCQEETSTKTPHFATLIVMALDPTEVGKRIKDAQKKRNWTNEDVARAMRAAEGSKTNARLVQRWKQGRDKKTGKPCLPRLNTLMTLADVLGVSRSFFVETEEERESFESLHARLSAEIDRLEGLNDEIQARLAG